MAQTATAPRRAAGARTAPARRAPAPAPRRSPRPRPALVPGAVGRTAVAVGDLADSGLVLRLTRSRGWIAVVGFLLVGIVALNVYALSLNTGSSRTAAQADELRRQNSALRADIADGLSNERLQRVAARLGLIVPEAGATLMLDPGGADAAAAARRLRRGEIALGSEAPVVAPAPVAAPAADPAAAADPVVAPEPAIAPAAARPAETTSEPVPAPGGGGVAP